MSYALPTLVNYWAPRQKILWRAYFAPQGWWPNVTTLRCNLGAESCALIKGERHSRGMHLSRSQGNTIRGKNFKTLIYLTNLNWLSGAHRTNRQCCIRSRSISLSHESSSISIFLSLFWLVVGGLGLLSLLVLLVVHVLWLFSSLLLVDSVFVLICFLFFTFILTFGRCFFGFWNGTLPRFRCISILLFVNLNFSKICL